MSQVVMPAAFANTVATEPTPAAPVNWQRVDLEPGLGPDAMQVRRRGYAGRWAESAASVPQGMLQSLHPATQAAGTAPVVHLVGDGHGFAKAGATIFGLIGFCCGYGFSTMAGEQLLLSVPSIPFNRDGVAQRTLATALVGFNLPFGIAGLAVGAAVGGALGALLDACTQ